MTRDRVALGVAAILLTAGTAALAAGAAEGPPFRVRITTDDKVATVECARGLRVLDRSGKPVWRDPMGTRITFVAEPKGDLRVVYRAQVASLSSEDEARKLADHLSARLKVPGRIHYHPDRGSWRVRVGEGASPESLDGLVRSLREMGYTEVWVTEDAPEGERGSLRLVDADWNDHRVAATSVRVVPRRVGDHLKVGERTYRGFVDVTLDRRSRLAVINELPLEEYLLGVVPNELGPEVFPEIEALKAQAVAARTYAWRNRGQFTEDGYDLCDTPRCQVYMGAGTEHPKTDQAVQETAGIVLAYHGEPINAMYTSTCGGHTENGQLLFLEEDGPYLRGVPCYPERKAARQRALTLEGQSPLAGAVDAEGRAVGREVWLLSSLGILEAASWSDGGGPTWNDWLTRTLAVVGKSSSSEEPRLVKTRNDLVRDIVARLGWDGRAALLVGNADLDYLLSFSDSREIPDRDRRDWGLILKDGLILPFADDTLRPDAAATRADQVRALAALVDHYGAQGLRMGKMRQILLGSLLLETRGGIERLRLDPGLRLVKVLRGQGYPVERLDALAGDPVRYHAVEDVGGRKTVTYLEVHVSGRSASDDRSAPLYEWEVRVERDEMADRLASRVQGIGKLVDLIPVERGVSGRVVVLKVVGTRGEEHIRGFGIRTALGIRETQFVIDRQRDADGNVTAFLFTGKGWGHGVGLCQIGAYGMALRGQSYQTILRHYYTGVSLQRIYG